MFMSFCFGSWVLGEPGVGGPRHPYRRNGV